MAALALWGAGMLVSAAAPWEFLDASRAELGQVRTIAKAMGGDAGPPRVLLLGSSPVEIGLSAQKIAAATGLPAFNLAAAGALSFFPDYLDDVLGFVRPDDIVVLSDPNWLNHNDKILSRGCVSRIDWSCVQWRPHPLPHLAKFIQVVLGGWSDPPAMNRDAVGDAVTVRSSNSAMTIPTVPFAGPFANDVAGQLRQAVEAIRARGGCPLLTLGPIYVDAREQEQWRREQERTEARVAKLGLALSVVTDGVINTDRSLFLDNYEHPAAAESEIWTDSIIRRLTSQSQSPCGRSLAKAEHIPSPS
jgi:hypothetical protein